MSRTTMSFEEDGFRRWLHGMDRRIKDLERGGDWRFDDELDAEEIVLAGGSPQLLCMSVTGDPIAAGGDSVTFDTVVSTHGGFTGATAAASWTHPVGGVYVLTYEHAWSSYTDGGTIQLQVDGADIPEGLIASDTSGQEGSKTIAYAAAEGSTGRIVITQSSGSAQTCDAKVWVALPDPSSTSSPGWRLRHFANSDFSTADPTHPATLEVVTPAGSTITMPADARWPGSGVVSLGAIDFASAPVLRHAGKGGATVLSSSAECLVTDHSGNPTNYDSQHQDITEITGPGWVYRWEVTDPAASGDFNDVYTYVWYAS